MWKPNFNGQEVLKVDAEGLSFLSEFAVREIFKLRTSHLEQVAAIFDDDDATENDRRVAYTLIKNASIAVAGVLPFQRCRNKYGFGKKEKVFGQMLTMNYLLQKESMMLLRKI